MISGGGRAREEPRAQHHAVRGAAADGLLRGRDARLRGADQRDARSASTTRDPGEQFLRKLTVNSCREFNLLGHVQSCTNHR